MKTAKVAASISGNMLYQKRAREALPILVRQAKSGNIITYSDLSEELKMPNPRNLNYVLGCIGTTLENISKEWGVEIPPIQCLVVNKQTGLPGEGIGWFLTKEYDFSSLSRRQKRNLVDAKLNLIYSFNEWNKVLSTLNIRQLKINFKNELDKAAIFIGGGESDFHKRMKEYISRNPKSVSLSAKTSNGEMEYKLPSGDTIDVLFKNKKDWIAVEVKSRISNDNDITRGIFQCIKYKAILEAMQTASGLPQNARAILALESELPEKLIALKNILNVEVIELIKIDI
ncbi:hypothetical protein H4F46_07170 [Pectobacterium brasiliense]|uniref:hypothetical protein n=1 Tax=Pectobacterium brasiliense TaxID=180957 RepID=UPI001969773A|nr:hypothetical protein [Pectobacterium brasiliense]MBN3114674.1 hypothetical protein [Pectobacterium brasiliense]